MTAHSTTAADPPDAATRRQILGGSLAIGVASGTYGASFGALSVGSGLDVVQTCVLSLLVFTGASQFALIGVLGAGGSPVAAVAGALLLGARNALYGLQLAPMLGWRGWRRLLGAQLVIDESTAMSVLRPTRGQARLGFLATGLSVFVLWNAATLLGALAGRTLGDPRQYGLDAAAAAAFLALLWPRLGTRDPRLVALGAAVLALALTPFVAPGVPVLVSAVVALAVGLASRKAEA